MTKAHDEIIQFIASGTTSHSVLAFRPSSEAKARVDDLIHRNRTNSLSQEEAAELTDCLELEHLMRMAKARAKVLIASE